MANVPKTKVIESGARGGKSYRYTLWRVWDENLPKVCWVMLNPSTACAISDDATSRKCQGFSKQWNKGGMWVINLYAYRATNPKDLKQAGYPVGEMNDTYIRETLRKCDSVVVAWGGNAQNERADEVLEIIRGCGKTPMALSVTKKDGHPGHPLYIPYTAEIFEFRANERDKQ